MSKAQDDSRLARWADKSISKDELQSLKEELDLDACQAILDEVDQWSLPELSSDSYSRLQALRTAKAKKKHVRLSTLSIAASVIFLLGFSFLFYRLYLKTDLTEVKALAEVVHYELPDGSVAVLNKGAQLSFDASTYANNREIEAKGNVYFEVQKGPRFVVNSPRGMVQVLGTKFEIIDKQDFYSVYCSEGKVMSKVLGQEEAHILPAGNGILYHHNEVQSFTSTTNAPGWISGIEQQEFVYEKANLFEVLRDLEQAFDVEIVSKVSLNRKFSGKFVSGNLDDALQAVCLPLGIRFEVSPDGLITLY